MNHSTLEKLIEFSQKLLTFLRAQLLKLFIFRSDYYYDSTAYVPFFFFRIPTVALYCGFERSIDLREIEF
jgi:hypothetical protein